MRLPRLISFGVAVVTLGAASPTFAQVEPYIGQLMVTGYNFCPVDWMSAEGQLLPISQYTALFALLGTTYGGNGTTNFALPDLRGRASMHTGTGPGLPPATEGEMLGSPSTTLTVSQMPAHSHSFGASSGAGAASTPVGNAFGTYGIPVYATPGAATVAMNPASIGSTGGSQPFDQYQPSLVMRYCIAVNGIFPQHP